MHKCMQLERHLPQCRMPVLLQLASWSDVYPLPSQGVRERDRRIDAGHYLMGLMRVRIA